MAKNRSSSEAKPDAGEKSPEVLSFKEFISAEIDAVENARDEYVAACDAKIEGDVLADASEVISVTTKLNNAFEEFKAFALAKLAEDGDEEEKKRQVAERRAETMSAIKQHGKSLDREDESETEISTEEIPASEASKEGDTEKKSELLEKAREFLINRTKELKSQVELARLVLEHKGFKDEDIEKLKKIHTKMDGLVEAFEEGSLVIIEDSSGDDLEAIKVEIEAAFDDTQQGLLELSGEAGVILKPYDSETSGEQATAKEVETPPDVEDDEHEQLTGEDIIVEDELLVGDVVGSEILVKKGATLRVFGDLQDSIIRVEVGGNFELKGDNDNSDIIENYVEAPPEPETPAVEESTDSKTPPEPPVEAEGAKSSGPIPDVPAGHEAKSASKPEATEAAPVETPAAKPTPAAESETATSEASEKSKGFTQEDLEKQLGYLDIHPKIIFESLEQSDIAELKGFMGEYRQADNELATANRELELVHKPYDEAKKPLEEATLLTNQLDEEVAGFETALSEAKSEKEKKGITKKLESARQQAKDARENEAKVKEQVDKIGKEILAKIDVAAEEARTKVYAAETKVADAREKIINFYKNKIKEILKNSGNEELLSDEELRKVSERINRTIQQTIDAAAQQEVAKMNMKKVKSLTVRAAVDAALVAAGSFGITALTGGIGAVASIGISASAVSGVRLLVRKLRGRREKGKQEENRAKEQAEIEEKKNEFLTQLFTNTEEFTRQLSGHISNTIREQTSGTALETLRVSAEEARDKGHGEVMDSTLSKMEKELYQSALVQIEANYPESEYPEIDAMQRHNMAVQLAMTLGQHERGELEAKDRLEELKGKNPAVYRFIEKYNMLSAGKPDSLPENASESDKKFWEKHKYDVYSFLVGTSVGLAIRADATGITRAALGAVGGAAMGRMVAEDVNRRQEKKAIGEITSMLKEAEELIEDINFPVNQLDTLRENSIYVQSKLDLGILDSDPLLKSRAENFIHNVRKIEMQNQELLDGLMTQMTANSEALEKQVETDVSRIEKHTKRRKVLFILGGAIVGGAAGFFGQGLFKKVMGEIMADHTGDDEVNTGGKVVPSPDKYSGDSDWKGETDPWKTGRVGIEAEEAKVSGASIDSTETTPVADTEPVVDVPKPLSHFEDVVDSSKVTGGSDSIWRSTRAIFSSNAEALGYKDDLGDTEALSKWAEAQTANVVNKLNVEQGGNLADLVHDGDVVKIDLVNGKPVLSFTEASGIEAGHLSDTNVEKFFTDTPFEEGVEHEPQIDANTGDQFVTLQTEEGIVKIYDWDRDGNPNVVMPDGSQEEMTPEQLRTFMEQKNIAMSTEEVTAQEARLAELARIDEIKTQIDGFLEGESAYSHEMYSVAKIEGSLDNVLQKMLSDNNTEQLEQFMGDYFKDHNMGDDKRAVFLHELAKLYGTDELRNYDGGMKRLMGAFESNVTRTYGEMEFAFDQTSGDKEWVPVAVGEKYALIRHDARFMRSDLFYIDTNGDGVPDAIKDADAMKEVFEGKQPLIKEHIKLPDDGKTFSLKRPDAPTVDADKINEPSPDTADVPAVVTPEAEAPKVEAETSEPVTVTESSLLQKSIDGIKEGQTFKIQALDYTRSNGALMFKVPGGDFQELTSENAAQLQEWNKYFEAHDELATTTTLTPEAEGVFAKIFSKPTEVPKVVTPEVVRDLPTDNVPATPEAPTPVVETQSVELPKGVNANISDDATRVMTERGITFKGGNLDVPNSGIGPIVFSKEAADTLGIELENVGVTDSIDIELKGNNLEVVVTDQDGTVDKLIFGEDNKLVAASGEEATPGVSVKTEVPVLDQDTPETPNTEVKTPSLPEVDPSAEQVMDPIDYAIGTLNAGGEKLDFKLEKINDYDLDYLNKVKAFTEAQIAAIGEDSTNPRAAALRNGMKIIDDEVALRIKGFKSPSV
jgi:hypothetical protein